MVILEWTLPELATPPDNIIYPSLESQFDVSGYFISMESPNDMSEYVEGRDSTSYLFGGLSAGTITFFLRVNYSRSEINDLIPGDTDITVSIPRSDGKLHISTNSQ